jgi:4-amino-4-deoxy-L-arabinose transferase-like glycosyltransferase
MLRPAHLLRHDKLAAWITDQPVPLSIAICAIWVLAGLIGHDPWKPDEAETFGVVYRLLESGDWIVPSLAGEPYLENPPLIYLTAALTGIVFSPVLPLHDAARLATGLWMALVFFFTAYTARELFGGNRGWMAALMLLGCGGLLVRGHQLTSDVALLAALAISLHGLAVAPRRPLLGGLWLGIGLGVAILSSGLYEPLMLVLAALGMAIVSPLYRTRGFARCVTVAVLIALPWALVWPLTLYVHSPELFIEWLWIENWERIAGLFRFNLEKDYVYYLNILPWFSWPAWPFAIWSLWIERREGLSRREVQLPLVAFAAFLVFLSLGSEGRDIHALPLLLPVSLLASMAFSQLPRGALNAYYWFTVMVATFFCLVAWLYFSAIEWEVPQRLADHMLDLQPAYVAEVHPLIIVLALLFTLAWLVLVFNVKRVAERPILLWAAGVTTVWTLVALLLVDWIDTGKTYRRVVGELTAALPQQHGCIASQGLGESQRAMLDYFAQTTTLRLEVSGGRPPCDWLITQDNWNQPQVIGAPWEMVWEGRRPGDKRERYRLYRRLPS